jgi:N-acetylglucosaminyl-diphospho-decaprenol L-rhamnosyltransferase
MALLVVVVNYRSAPWTELCLAALGPELLGLGPDAEAVVVDNASGDGSSDRLRRFVADQPWADRVRIVDAPENGGFSYGNNLAIEPWLAARPTDPDDAVMLLNPDTEVLPGSLRTLLAFMATHPHVGIAGARLEHPDGRPQACSFRFLGAATEIAEAVDFGPLTRLLSRWTVLAPPAPVPMRVDWVSGAAMLVRRTVFDAVGLMDEGFFLYFEELDFTRRAADAGFECWHVPAARIVHHVGRTTGVTSEENAARRRPPYWFASRQRYMTRHLGPRKAVVLDAAVVLGNLAGIALSVVRRRTKVWPEQYLRDFVRHAFFARKEPQEVSRRRSAPRLAPAAQLAKGSA